MSKIPLALLTLAMMTGAASTQSPLKIDDMTDVQSEGRISRITAKGMNREI